MRTGWPAHCVCDRCRRYVGQWLDGKMHGHGTYSYADGDKYEGEWKDDKVSGVRGVSLCSGTVRARLCTAAPTVLSWRSTRATGSRARCRAWAATRTRTAASTRASGSTRRCTARVSTTFLTATATTASGSMTSRRATESSRMSTASATRCVVRRGDLAGILARRQGARAR